MSWGSIYSESHFGNANEDNTIGWGIMYPIIAGGSYLITSLTKIFTDSINYLTDQIKI